LTNLSYLYLDNNHLTTFSLPVGLTHLTTLNLGGNQLTTLTLPAGAANLTSLDVTGNPLAALVLPEPAVPALSPPLDTLRSQGVAVYAYPLETRLAAGDPTPAGVFALTLTGPPGSYRVQITGDFSTWADAGEVANATGSATFTDTSALSSSWRFYRVQLEE
jgi:hypothetical protein